MYIFIYERIRLLSFSLPILYSLVHLLSTVSHVPPPPTLSHFPLFSLILSFFVVGKVQADGSRGRCSVARPSRPLLPLLQVVNIILLPTQRQAKAGKRQRQDGDDNDDEDEVQ